MFRQRYVPRKTEEAKKDPRVSVTGKISSVGKNSFVIQDCSGEVEVSSGYPVEKGNLVRVFCRVDEGKLKGDTVQDLNGLDLNLYQKVQDLYRKFGI